MCVCVCVSGQNSDYPTSFIKECTTVQQHSYNTNKYNLIYDNNEQQLGIRIKNILQYELKLKTYLKFEFMTFKRINKSGHLITKWYMFKNTMYLLFPSILIKISIIHIHFTSKASTSLQ